MPPTLRAKITRHLALLDSTIRMHYKEVCAKFVRRTQGQGPVKYYPATATGLDLHASFEKMLAECAALAGFVESKKTTSLTFASRPLTREWTLYRQTFEQEYISKPVLSGPHHALDDRYDPWAQIDVYQKSVARILVLISVWLQRAEEEELFALFKNLTTTAAPLKKKRAQTIRRRKAPKIVK